MNLLASNVSDTLYRAVRPVLFKLAPDSVHTKTAQLGSFTQKSTAVRALLRWAWRYEDVSLVQRIAGSTFANPIGLSAGFDKNIELPPLMQAIGFGFMEGGTITNLPSDGNPRPWFYRLPHTKSVVVHSGLANEGVQKIMRRVRRYKPALFNDFPLNISVGPTNLPSVKTLHKAITDCIECLRKVNHADAGQLITINISCPNTYDGEPFTSAPALEQLLTQVDALHLQAPLFLKMPIDLPWYQFDELLHVAAKHTVAGVTIGNLTKRRGVISDKDKLPPSVPGGISGKPTFVASNQLIQLTRHHYRDRFIIIGVGGVFDADDAYAKIRLGANLVALVTGLIYGGPQQIGRINRDLAKKIKHDGFTHISEAVGVDAR